jgi:hypothetical protein
MVFRVSNRRDAAGNEEEMTKTLHPVPSYPENAIVSKVIRKQLNGPPAKEAHLRVSIVHFGEQRFFDLTVVLYHGIVDL